MKKFRIVSFLLFLIAFILKFVSYRHPHIVENIYSNKIDVYIVKFLSRISSTFSFSYFEIMIYIFILSIITSIIYLIYIGLKNRNKLLSSLKNTALNYMSVVFLIYFLFMILWGINYNRVSLYETILLDYNNKNKASVENIDFDRGELIKLCSFLIEKCNESKKIVNNLDSEIKPSDKLELISKLEDAYDEVEFLDLDKLGSYSKAKIILNSNLLTYTGITGIYSPFTGEANINTNQPVISMPFTILHEMAHQRGYADESEANFLAYISCIENEDSYVNYSGYYMALRYSLVALINVDYKTYEDIKGSISKEVVADLNSYSEFWSNYQSKASDISDSVNNMYLKHNRVESGIKSYGKVVDLLLLYYYLYG